MKKYSKQELTKLAQEVFKGYPNEKKLYATADGNFFLEKEKGSAKDHAKKQKLGDLIEISREAAPAPVENKTAAGNPSQK